MYQNLNEESEPAYWPTHDWESSLPEEQGLDSAQLVRMLEYIEENDTPLHSLLIVRNGYLVSDSPDLKIGLDNRYRLTESPNSRPIGLRGHWLDPATFYLDYIVFGDFIRSEARIKFTDNKMSVTITYLNWNSPPIVLRGRIHEQ